MHQQKYFHVKEKSRMPNGWAKLLGLPRSATLNNRRGGANYLATIICFNPREGGGRNTAVYFAAAAAASRGAVATELLRIMFSTARLRAGVIRAFPYISGVFFGETKKKMFFRDEVLSELDKIRCATGEGVNKFIYARLIDQDSPVDFIITRYLSDYANNSRVLARLIIQCL